MTKAGSLKCLSPWSNPRRALCRLCFLCLSLRAALRSDWGWAPPCSCRWQGAFFVVKSWWSLHMKNISLELLLPSFSSFLSVSLCRCQRLQLKQWYRDIKSQSLAPFPPRSLFFLSFFLSYHFLPPSHSSIVSFYHQPSLFSALPTNPPSLSLAYRSELGLRRKIQVKPLSFQTAW